VVGVVLDVVGVVLGDVGVEPSVLGAEPGKVTVGLGELAQVGLGAEVEMVGVGVRLVDVGCGLGLCEPDGNIGSLVGEDVMLYTGLHPATATKAATAERMVRVRDSLVVAIAFLHGFLGRSRYGTSVRRIRRFTDKACEGRTGP
jgi:hypothetical protein